MKLKKSIDNLRFPWQSRMKDLMEGATLKGRRVQHQKALAEKD